MPYSRGVSPTPQRSPDAPIAGVVLLDFDGTACTVDVGDVLCRRLCDASAWQAIRGDYDAGRLTLPEFQRRIWARARATREEVVSLALEIAALRPGLDAFLEAARAAGLELWLASGGFDFYIEALLGERIGAFSRVWCNAMDFGEAGLAPRFPHAGLGCERCGICKGKLADRALRERIPVAMVGDGHSDRCAAERPIALASPRDSFLAGWAHRSGRDVTLFEAFDELIPWLSRVPVPA